jgi:hypothetical protein
VHASICLSRVQCRLWLRPAIAPPVTAPSKVTTAAPALDTTIGTHEVNMATLLTIAMLSQPAGSDGASITRNCTRSNARTLLVGYCLAGAVEIYVPVDYFRSHAANICRTKSCASRLVIDRFPCCFRGIA